MLIGINRYSHYMTVLDSSFCTVERTTWLWKFLSSSLPQCLCQEHEETCSQTKSRRRNRNHSKSVKMKMRVQKTLSSYVLLSSLLLCSN